MDKVKTASEIERDNFKKSFGIWISAITVIRIFMTASLLFAWVFSVLWFFNAEEMGKAGLWVDSPFVPYLAACLFLSVVLFLVTLPKALAIKRAWKNFYSSKELLSPGMEPLECIGSGLNGHLLDVRFDDGKKSRFFVTDLLNVDGSALLEVGNQIPDRTIWGVPRNLYALVWTTHDGKVARLRGGCAFRDTKQVEIGIEGGTQRKVYFDTLRPVSVQ